MKEYQDTATGMIYAFEDGYDPSTTNNRNIPKTLTAAVKPKPDDSHVWYQSTWIKLEDAPAGYTPLCCREMDRPNLSDGKRPLLAGSSRSRKS